MTTEEDDQIRFLQEELGRRQFRRRSPKRISTVVNGLLARRGYAQQLANAALADAWREAVGAQFAKVSRVYRLRRRVLEVVVRDSSVMQELTFQQSQLLDRLAGRLQEYVLTGLRFRVGQVD